MSKPSELYACLYVREFPAQALLRLRPELRGRAFVVMEGIPPSEQVCSANHKARSLGAAHSMTKVEISTIPTVAVLSRSLSEEEGAMAALLECAGGFTPRIEEQPHDLEFVCVLDIAGTEMLFGPPSKLATNILVRVKSLGIVASIAVSANFHTALCAAKGMGTANRALVIAAGDEGVALAPLPLTVLALSKNNAETFSLWGIRTLGQLAALPETSLISRIGQEGKRLQLIARGELPHLFLPLEPTFSLQEYIELDSPVEVLDSLLFVVGVMLEQLIVRAVARVLALASVTVELSLEGGITHARTVKPALPSTDRQLWIKLIHLDLEAHPPRAAILALGLSAEPGSTSKVQLGLFSPQLPEAARLDVTLARIRAIVGEENVGRAVLRDTHRRDGFRIEPFTVPSGKPHSMAQGHEGTAMRQLNPAESITVSLQDKRPHTVFFRGKRYAIERAYGPWVSSGEWWSSERWSIQQWDLIARSNDDLLCCSVLRDAQHGHWLMAGIYD